jgi:hypothetical protein
MKTPGTSCLRLRYALLASVGVSLAAGKQAERLHDKLVAALRDALRQFVRPEGVMMNSNSLMVIAQNPR